MSNLPQAKTLRQVDLCEVSLILSASDVEINITSPGATGKSMEEVTKRLAAQQFLVTWLLWWVLHPLSIYVLEAQ